MAEAGIAWDRTNGSKLNFSSTVQTQKNQSWHELRFFFPEMFVALLRRTANGPIIRMKFSESSCCHRVNVGILVTTIILIVGQINTAISSSLVICWPGFFRTSSRKFQWSLERNSHDRWGTIWDVDCMTPLDGPRWSLKLAMSCGWLALNEFGDGHDRLGATW